MAGCKKMWFNKNTLYQCICCHQVKGICTTDLMTMNLGCKNIKSKIIYFNQNSWESPLELAKVLSKHIEIVEYDSFYTW